MKRTIFEKLKNQLPAARILVLLSPKGNRRVNLIKELFPTEEELSIFNLTNKKEKNGVDELKETDFASFFSTKKTVVFHEAQVLSNLEQLVEHVLNLENHVNLILICSFLPNLNEDLLAALKQQDLLVTNHSPSFQELASHEGLSNFEKNLEDKLIFGNFTAHLDEQATKITFLEKQLEKLINEPISEKDRVNKKEKLLKMLQYVSFKIGEHLSFNEIAEKAGLDNETVERYCDLLEKSFVLIRLPVFCNNNKYELKKTNCFYFYDNGIRNALIKNYNALDLRLDGLELWKNWLISEKYKQKRTNFTNNADEMFFWKTHTGQTVDLLIKEKTDSYTAYLFQFVKKEKRKIPKSFEQFYPDIKVKIINKATYWTFLVK